MNHTIWDSLISIAFKYCKVGKYLLSVSGLALKSPKKNVKPKQDKINDQSEAESLTTEKESSQIINLQRVDSKMEIGGESCLLVDIPLSQYEAGFYFIWSESISFDVKSFWIGLGLWDKNHNLSSWFGFGFQ